MSSAGDDVCLALRDHGPGIAEADRCDYVYDRVNEAPVPGAHGCRVAFLHPEAGHGVLIELSERSRA